MLVWQYQLITILSALSVKKGTIGEKMKTTSLTVKQVRRTDAAQLGLLFGIDQPIDNQMLIDNNLLVSGWVIGTDSVVDKIIIGGGINIEIPVIIERPDVLLQMGKHVEIENFCPLINGTRRCGFSEKITLPQFYVGTPIDITAILQNGNKIPLVVITFLKETASSEILPHPEMLKSVAKISQAKLATQFFYFGHHFGNKDVEGGHFLYSCRLLSHVYPSTEWPDLTVTLLPQSKENSSIDQYYDVFIPVPDPNKFMKNTPSAIEQLPEYVIEDLNNKKCSLVFDASNEASRWWLCVFIRNGLQDRGLHDFSNVMLISQNRILSDKFTDFSVYPFDYYLVEPAISLHAQLDENELWNGNFHSSCEKAKNILCLNATPRPHRWLTVATLINKGMQENSLISFPGDNYSKKTAMSVQDVLNFSAKTAGLENLNEAIHWLSQNSPLKVDDFTEEGNALVNKIDFLTYEQTIMSIVTESDVIDYYSIQRITEKSLKAFAIGHPSVIVGLFGSIKWVEELGFDVFRNFIDHSYDQIDDWVLRMNTSIDEAISFCEAWRNGSIDVDKIQSISQKNRDWLRSGFFEHYSRRYAFPILSALSNKQ